MRNILSFILLLLISMSSFGADPPCPFPPCEIYPELPIDGGITLLLVVGVLYGVYEDLKSK